MGQFFLLTLKFENVINLLLLCLSNLEYKTILLCCHKQSPSKCYSGRFFYYNTFLDSIFFLILSRTTFVGHTVDTYLHSINLSGRSMFSSIGGKGQVLGNSGGSSLFRDKHNSTSGPCMPVVGWC